MRIPEEDDEQGDIGSSTTEGRRITIRLGSGSAVGVNTASYGARRIRQEQSVRVKSNKQGPSHRKARRWNNDNFVNLAAELSSGKGSGAAVEALLKGSAGASKYRSVFDPKQHESKAMKKFREDKNLSIVREKFFDGALPCDNTHSSTSKRKVVTDTNLLTPLERFHRIETRLRRIVVKACENSYAASKVVNALEEFLIQVHNGEQDERSQEEWQEFLLDSPTVTIASRSTTKTNDEAQDSVTTRPDKRIIKFLFDADSATGGFHRLLLHGVCQFHCLSATSSTTRVNGKKARVLAATGTFTGANVRLVDYIMERQKSGYDSTGTQEVTNPESADQMLSSKLSALKV